MKEDFAKKPLGLALGAAFALVSTGLSAAADASPFGSTALASGYQVATNHTMVAEGKCGEGKCGGEKKAEEGKCGEGKCGAEKKAHEGKCGEGKCGGDKKPKEGEGASAH